MGIRGGRETTTDDLIHHVSNPLPMGIRLRLDRDTRFLHLPGALEHVGGVDALLLDDVGVLRLERGLLAVALDVETVAAAGMVRGAGAGVDALGAEREPLLVRDAPTLLADE